MSVGNSRSIIFKPPRRQTSASSCKIYGNIKEIIIFVNSSFCSDQSAELNVDNKATKLSCTLNFEDSEYTAYRLNVSQTSVTLYMPESERFLDNGLSRLWIAVIGNTLLCNIHFSGELSLFKTMSDKSKKKWKQLT